MGRCTQSGPLGQLRRFAEENIPGVLPGYEDEERPSKKKGGSSRMSPEEAARRKQLMAEAQPRGWEQPAKPAPGGYLPAEPPKGARDFAKDLAFSRQIVEALDEASRVVKDVGPEGDVPGAGFGMYLADRAGRIGAGVGAGVGGFVGTAGAPGVGTLLGAGAGAALGGAAGEVVGGLAQKGISDEGLQLQRAVASIGQALTTSALASRSTSRKAFAS